MVRRCRQLRLLVSYRLQVSSVASEYELCSWLIGLICTQIFGFGVNKWGNEVSRETAALVHCID